MFTVHVWCVYLRLLERGRTCGDLRPSSSVMLSVLPKCLDRKCSSSMVGWKGSWCRRSWDELDDWSWGKDENRKRQCCYRTLINTIWPMTIKKWSSAQLIIGTWLGSQIHGGFYLNLTDKRRIIHLLHKYSTLNIVRFMRSERDGLLIQNRSRRYDKNIKYRDTWRHFYYTRYLSWYSGLLTKVISPMFLLLWF